jgi:hypothetical protein
VIPETILALQSIARKGPQPRSFAVDAHVCIMVWILQRKSEHLRPRPPSPQHERLASDLSTGNPPAITFLRLPGFIGAAHRAKPSPSANRAYRDLL